MEVGENPGLSRQDSLGTNEGVSHFIRHLRRFMQKLFVRTRDFASAHIRLRQERWRGAFLVTAVHGDA